MKINLRQGVARLQQVLQFFREFDSGLFKGILIFLDNTRVYLFEQTPRRGPMFVGWNLLFNCNAHCSFRDTHELHKKLKREMSTEEALSVVRQIGQAGTWHLSLTGGETLLRNDLPEIIREAKKYNIFVNVNTNGALLAKKAERLVNSGLDSLIISLDSPDAEIHDTARQIPQLSDNLLRGIEAVKKYRGKRKKPYLTLRCVISKQNYRQLDEYVQRYAPRVDKISIQPIHDGIQVPRFSRSDPLNLFHIKEENLYSFDPDERNAFASTFNAFLQKYPRFDKPFIRDFEAFLFDKGVLWEKYKCYAGYYYLVIDPALETFPCTFFVDRLGSLHDHSLMDIWRGQAIKKWRRHVKQKKNQCLYWCGIAEVNAKLSPYLK